MTLRESECFVVIAMRSSVVGRVAVLDLLTLVTSKDGDFELRFGLDITCVYEREWKEREREREREREARK